MNQPKLRLRYAKTSPYVRKVLVLAREAGLLDRIEIVPTDPWSEQSGLEQDNPLGKIPALVTPEGVLPESILCCEYLDSLHGGHRFFPSEGPVRWRALRHHALAQGILDAAVLTVVETRRRPQEYHWPGFVERQRAKIRRTLDLLEKEAEAIEGDLTIGSIAIACALGYLDFRLPDLGWREGRGHLAAWYLRMSERASMRATDPQAA